MSAVTAQEIITAVAAAYGLARGQIIANEAPADVDEYTRRRRLQARMVSIHLIGLHTPLQRPGICREIGVPVNGSSYELIDLALYMVPLYLGYDGKMAERVERAEARIDAIHDRRVERMETRTEQVPA